MIEQPKVCGSVIDQIKQTVSEQMNINSPDFYLTYSSEFNPYIKKNRSVYQELKNIPANRGRLALSIYPNTYSSAVVNRTTVYPPITVNWQWDGIAGNVSTNQIVSKSRFIVELNDLPLVQTPAPALSSASNQLYINYIDDLGQTISQVRSYLGSDDMYAYPIYFEGHDLVIYRPEVWGLSGWTMSHHHYFERGTKVLYSGSGEKIAVAEFKTVSLPEYGAVDLVSTHYANEIYIFNSDGVHLETRTKILGKTKYKFNYQIGSTKILGFTDINNKLTEITYNTDGSVSKIKYSNGFETDFQTENGLIKSVSEFQKQKYVISYDLNNLMTSFKKPNGETTTFNYDGDGRFLSELKNTGPGQFFLSSLIGELKSFINSNNQGFLANTEFEEIANDSWIRQKNADGSIISSTLVRPNSKTVYTGTNTFTYSKFADEIWGRHYDEVNPQFATYQESGHNMTATSYNSTTFQYSNLSNPFSLTSVTEKSSPSSSLSLFNLAVLDVATKKITQKSITNKTTTIQLDDAEWVIRIAPENQFPTNYTYNLDGKLSRIQKGSEFTDYIYNGAGLLRSQTNSKNQTTSYAYNEFGQLAV